MKLPIPLMLMFAVFAAVWSGCIFAAPGYRGPKTEHFDGEQFHNQDGVRSPGFKEIRKLLRARSRETSEWGDFFDAPPGPKPPAAVENGRMRVTFVNHATLLVQLDGVNILTDPIWSKRASPVQWLGPERVRPPGIRFEDLPTIHAVVVSHNHYDHMDLETLQRLYERFKPKIFVGLGNAEYLRGQGIDTAVDLDWWQSSPVNEGVRITAVPAQHGSNRGLVDRAQTLWAGYLIAGSAGYAYFAGDTGYGRHFAQIRDRFGPPRLAMLPIGAFRPEWFMAPVHLSPMGAISAHRTLEAGRSVGMHYGTFNLGLEGRTEPPSALTAALRPAEKDEFWVLEFGEGRDVP